MATIAPLVVDVQPSNVGLGLSHHSEEVPVAHAVQVSHEPVTSGTAVADYAVPVDQAPQATTEAPIAAIEQTTIPGVGFTERQPVQISQQSDCCCELVMDW